MAGDAAQRYATATDLADDLRAFLENRPIRARRASAVEQFRRWCHRNPAVSALSAAVAILVLVLGGGLWLSAVLRSERDLALASQVRAEKAERENQIRTHLASATAFRRSGRPGQQIKALEEIRKALDLEPSSELKQELRNEAIAAFVLPDLQVAREWEGFPVGANSLTADPIFERFAHGDSLTGKVNIYRVSDSQLIQTLEGAGPVSGGLGVEFSPDGRFIHQICERDASFRSRLLKLDGPEPVAIVDDEHGHCAFEPHGSHCAMAYPDQTVRLVDLETGKETKRIRHHLRSLVYSLAWNPRYPLLALASDDGCQVFDLDTGKARADLPQKGGVDWHPDGNILAICADDLRIYLLDYNTGKTVLPPLEGHKNAGVSCRFNHAGNWLVSNDWSGLMRLWDTSTGQQLLSRQGAWSDIRFSSNDELLGPFAIGGKVQLLQCSTGKGLRTVASGERTGPFNGFGRACIDETGRWLAAHAGNGSALIDLWRVSVPVVLPERGNNPLRFDTSDHSLWTHGDHGLLRWAIRSEGPDGEIIRVGPAQQLASWTTGGTWGSSQDGKIVAVPRHWEGTILWHKVTNEIIKLGPQDDVRNAAVSPDGRWVATASHWLRRGGGAKVWDGMTGKQVAELPVRGECAVHFSPGGRWLVTCSAGYRLWEVGTWREGPSLGNSFNTIPYCAFTLDDRLLALQDQPELIRIVDPDTGREIARLTVSANVRPVPLSFSPDGARLAVMGEETRDLHLFDLRAIREELQALNLDWDAPPLPPPPELPAKPVQWVIEMADTLKSKEADRLIGEAAQFAAEKKHVQALAALRQAIQIDPSQAVASNNLAWFLLTGPKDLRDPKAALPLARKAVELEPMQSLFRNTLGVALYRTGAFEEAIPVLEKSLEMGNGTADAFDLFFLAMCHRQLGEAAKAKDCYDRATRWVETQHGKLNPTWSAELTEFEAEARGVLSLPEVPPTK
jgi:WD40 repeat protein/Tfp pilus assembly protein PilF